MKRKVFISLTLLALLASCGGNPVVSTSSSQSSSQSTSSSQPTPQSTSSSQPSSQSTSSSQSSSQSTSSSQSSSQSSSEPTSSNSGDGGSSSKEEKKQYTVTFKDENGNVLNSSKVNEDVVPSYTYNVDSKDNDEWDYTFVGWGTSIGSTQAVTLVKPTKDIDYYAIVNKVKKQYTITYNVNGGSPVPETTVDYGTVINTAPKPTKDGYTFTSWTLTQNGNDKVTFPYTVTNNVTLYAQYNEYVDLKQYLSTLLNGYELDPYSFIKDQMKPEYGPNLVTPASLLNDYSTDVNVSAIKQHGFGEQWQMVIDNLNQSTVFFNVLTVVESISGAAISAFNNYFDSNPGSSASYTFVQGIYNVNIECTKDDISFVLEYTNTFPLVGEQKAQIALTMDNNTKERTARIQLGDANALVYSFDESSYNFAIKYLGVRRAYFSLEKQANNDVVGHIYEYVGYGEAMVSSCADFLIGNDYTAVVGNKANAIPGFKGYIVELYDSSSGKLLGFKKKETLSILGISAEYDTYGFDLSYYSGINTIKQSPDDDKKYRVNGSANDFEETTVGGFNTKRYSRRFYIETSKQYFYSKEGEDLQSNEVDVPMLLVQEPYLAALNEEIKKDNDYLNINLILATAHVTKLDNIYLPMIETFIQNKELMTADEIVELIGNPYSTENDK